MVPKLTERLDLAEPWVQHRVGCFLGVQGPLAACIDILGVLTISGTRGVQGWGGRTGPTSLSGAEATARHRRGINPTQGEACPPAPSLNTCAARQSCDLGRGLATGPTEASPQRTSPTTLEAGTRGDALLGSGCWRVAVLRKARLSPNVNVLDGVSVSARVSVSGHPEPGPEWGVRRVWSLPGQSRGDRC